MSLFNTCNWWSTKCESNDPAQFDSQSICVSNFNSSPTGNYVRIVIGNHEGTVWIFRPEPSGTAGVFYSAKDLLLQAQLPAPVLQINVGKFVSSSPNDFIGILHPKKFAVYNLVIIPGVAEHGDQSDLTVIYEHKLPRLAANFIRGQFGGVQNRDFVCIQSLDGVLSFYEQEVFSFCCFLPDHLVPVAIVYVPRSDTFVCSSSDRQISCYRYQSLSNIGVNSTVDQVTSEKIVPEWQYNVSEIVQDIQTVTIATFETAIIVLGDAYFYCLNEHGNLRFMKKLNYTALCMHCYLLETEQKPMIMIVSDTKTLFLYENLTLRWATQLDFAPTALTLGSFPNLRNGLVLLSQHGELQCAYLGTRPSKFMVPPLNNKPIDLDRAERELDELETRIAGSKNEQLVLKSSVSDKEVIARVKINPYLTSVYSEIFRDTINECELFVDVRPLIPLDEIHVTVRVHAPLTCEPSAFFRENVAADDVRWSARVRLSDKFDVVSLRVDVLISYVTTAGVPRVLSRDVQLPLKLVATVVTPVVQDALFKVSVNTNEPSLRLNQLYPEFLTADNPDVPNQTWTIAFTTAANPNVHVTIIVGKSLKKYRVQSNAFPALHCYLEDLINRLRAYFHAGFQLMSNTRLPVNDLLAIVGEYSRELDKYQAVQANLTSTSTQFRLIQRRLVTKFKEKNPTSLVNLKFLMDDTYAKISTSIDTTRKQQLIFAKHQNDLRAALRLVLLLLRLTNIPEEIFLDLETVLFVDVNENDDQRWMETVFDGLGVFLATLNGDIGNGERLGKVGMTEFNERLLTVFDRVVKAYSTVIEEDDESIEES